MNKPDRRKLMCVRALALMASPAWAHAGQTVQAGGIVVTDASRLPVSLSTFPEAATRIDVQEKGLPRG